MEHLENFHIIEVLYVAPTNSTGSRVKIISGRFDQSIKIPFNHEFNNVYDIAQAYLKNAGFSFVGKAESKTGYFLISTTFKPLKKWETWV